MPANPQSCFPNARQAMRQTETATCRLFAARDSQFRVLLTQELKGFLILSGFSQRYEVQVVSIFNLAVAFPCQALRYIQPAMLW
jgi:hypothetical protein